MEIFESIQTSKELNISIENAYHYQEGIIIICKDNGKEEVLLDTWKKLSFVLDEFEIKELSYELEVL